MKMAVQLPFTLIKDASNRLFATKEMQARRLGPQSLNVGVYIERLVFLAMQVHELNMPGRKNTIDSPQRSIKKTSPGDDLLA